ncbi:MAG: hypothetical protein Q4F18_15515, partial [Clostridia bacterium]|nr:hypothetical protein [Clostridia bacterium]
NRPMRANAAIFYAISYKSKSAPGALPLPKRFNTPSVSVLAARFFAQRPVAASTSENRCKSPDYGERGHFLRNFL